MSSWSEISPLNIPDKFFRLGIDEIRYTLLDPPPRIDEPKGTGMTKWISVREIDSETGKDTRLVHPLISLNDRLKVFK